MSVGRESWATENLGRAPRGRLQSARLRPTSSPSWREKKPTAPRTSAPPTPPHRTPLPQALPSPGAIVKWLGKRLVIPGLLDPVRFQSPGATAPLRAVHNSESPRTRFAGSHLPPPPRRPPRLPTSPPGGTRAPGSSSARRRRRLRSPLPGRREACGGRGDWTPALGWLRVAGPLQRERRWAGAPTPPAY